MLDIYSMLTTVFPDSFLLSFKIEKVICFKTNHLDPIRISHERKITVIFLISFFICNLQFL